MPTKRLATTELILITLILLAAFALRIHALDRQSLWSDEGLAVYYIGGTAIDVVNIISEGFHNPLYFLGLHFWAGAAGESDWAIRFYSVLLSVLAVAFIYVLGTLLYGRNTGLIAALILAANPFSIYYAQEARMYAQVLALSLGTVIMLILALREDRFIYWLGYILFASGCLYTHYYAALGPLAAGFYYILSWLRGHYKHVLPRWLLANAAIAVLYLPWFANALGMLSVTSWQEPTSPLFFPWQSLTKFSLGEVFPFASAPWMGAAFVLLLGLGCAAMFMRRESCRDCLLLPVYCIVPLLVIVVLAATGRGILEKYATVLLAPFCLTLALGVQFPYTVSRKASEGIFKCGLRIIFSALLLGFILVVDWHAIHAYYTDVRYFKPDYRSTAAYIAANELSGDVLLADGFSPDIVFQRYYTGTLPIHRVDLGEPDHEELLLARLTGTHDRTWLMLHSYEPGRIEYWLEQHGYQIERNEFSNVKLYLYDFPEDITGHDWVENPPQEASGPAKLLRYSIDPDTVSAGQITHLTLAWQVEQPPGIAYKLSVRLADPTGLIVWARDRFPIEGIVPSDTWQPGREILDNLGIPVPLGTLPGPYSLSIVLYEASTGTPVVKADLGTVEVTPTQSESITALTGPAIDRFGHDIELVKYDLPSGPFRAGNTLDMFILWHVLATPNDAVAVLRLQNGSEILAEQRIEHLTYPMSGWRENEWVRYPYVFQVDPALPSGEYELTLDLIDSVTGQALRTEPLLLGPLDVRSRTRNYQKPGSVPRQVEARLGETIQLIGYDLSPTEASPGETVVLTLYWQATGRTDTDYTVFTHLLTPDGQFAAGRDSPPLDGEAPTSSWLQGEYLADRYEWTVPSGASAGSYPVEVGMYDPVTGQRLAVFLDGTLQPGDCLLLDLPVEIVL